MTTEPETKPEQQGASAAPPQTAPPIDNELPPAAAHSTPVRKDQAGERDAGGKADQQPSEDDRTSHWSKSPVKVTRRPRNMQCKITLLDGSDYTCVVEKRDKGQVLFEKVCEHLNLLEKDYFGITYRDVENQKNWLDPAKDMKKQIRGIAWNFFFNVKFYPPEPALLSEDITRYYLCLQLRDDIMSGRLPCSFATHTVLGSYTVQSELGDYDPDEYGTDYISEFRFAPQQTKEMEEKITDLHKTYKGMTPAEAEMHFLENVKKLSMYGVDLHHAKDSEGVEIMLGVCSSGLLIYRDRLRINRFAWPKVLKISYKRNNFYIKIRPGEFEQFESTIGFKLPNHRAAKRLWKVCVEHHTFFRLVSPETPPKKFLTLGSKFRYSGRTQAQTRRASSQIVRPAPYFERSSSKRYTMSRSLDGAQRSTPMNTANGTRPTEMGTALYGTAKGVAVSDLITTVTPERKTTEDEGEQDRVMLVDSVALLEEEDESTKVTEVSQPSPLTPIRQDTRTDFTDTAVDGDLTATESDQDDESEIKTQFIKQNKEVNVFIRHSKLMIEEIDQTPDELLKHQTNISELKRTFLEGGTDRTGLTEWEKRLSSSPLRSPRLDEAPMIEPLVPEEMKQESAVGGSTTQDSLKDRRVDVPKPSFDEMSPELTALLQSTHSWSSAPPSALITPSSLSSHKPSESQKSHPEDIQSEEEKQPSDKPLDQPQSEPLGDTQQMPVIHTEMKTITYESMQQGEADEDTEPGILMSAQTITSETSSTTTTTHITKTVKGGISETRIEKRIVISGDADIDHDEALAQAIKEAKEQHPDMSVTKVVVHKETEITPEEGEE
ncbi:band 4.1-like protein 3a isoform X8 [Paramisgurnus dabryanus]|uniref:band 4.1-like protein 3a isoform X8 n=1 Tax=Paramisgurnus dabryanus TaxID=90735 RepID=UPI0031F466AD